MILSDDSTPRGEIRWVKLDPTLGVETKKIRACSIGDLFLC